MEYAHRYSDVCYPCPKLPKGDDYEACQFSWALPFTVAERVNSHEPSFFTIRIKSEPTIGKKSKLTEAANFRVGNE
jgi:hypothetical protein